MTTIKRIDHVAMVVDNIDSALGFWQDALGLELQHMEDVPDQQSLVAFLPSGSSEIELVEPTSSESGVARYLEERGAGFHHICFEVDDIEKTLDRLKEKKVQLINQEAIIGTGGKKIAFVHPDSTKGILVELYELTPQEPEIRLARVRSLSASVLTGGVMVGSAALAFLKALRSNNKTKNK